MTVYEVTPVLEYTLIGSDKFPITFKFLEDTDIVVTYIDTDGVVTVLQLNVDYTILEYPMGGGELTLLDPTIRGTLIIERDLPTTQEVDWVNNDPLDMEVQEASFDKLTMLIQEIEAHSIGYPPGFPTGVEFPFPESGKLLGWNEAGDNLQNYPGFEDFYDIMTDATTAADRAEAAADEAEASAAAAALSAANASLSEQNAAASEAICSAAEAICEADRLICEQAVLDAETAEANATYAMQEAANCAAVAVDAATAAEILMENIEADNVALIDSNNYFQSTDPINIPGNTWIASVSTQTGLRAAPETIGLISLQGVTGEGIGNIVPGGKPGPDVGLGNTGGGFECADGTYAGTEGGVYTDYSTLWYYRYEDAVYSPDLDRWIIDKYNTSSGGTIHYAPVGEMPTIANLQPASITTAYYDAIMWGNGIFVATHREYNMNDVWISSDGITWTNQVANGIATSGYTYDHGMFAFGMFIIYRPTYDTTTQYATSTDGVNWTQRGIPLPATPTNRIHGLYFFQDKLWTRSEYTGDEGDYIWLNSSDGINWTQLPRYDFSGFYASYYVTRLWGKETRLFALVTDLSDSTKHFFYSDDDGVTWTLAEWPEEFSTIVYSETTKYFCGFTDTNTYFSCDGVEWTLSVSRTGEYINYYNIFEGGGSFALVSPDTYTGGTAIPTIYNHKWTPAVASPQPTAYAEETIVIGDEINPRPVNIVTDGTDITVNGAAPNVGSADYASEAGHASTADNALHASTASSATTADYAVDSERLGGVLWDQYATLSDLTLFLTKDTSAGNQFIPLVPSIGGDISASVSGITGKVNIASIGTIPACPLYCRSDLVYDEANAASAATMPATCAMVSEPALQRVMFFGMIHDSAFFSPMNPGRYYVASGGGSTQSPPNSNGNIVQVFGWVVAPKTRFVFPQLNTVTVSAFSWP